MVEKMWVEVVGLKKCCKNQESVKHIFLKTFFVIWWSENENGK